MDFRSEVHLTNPAVPGFPCYSVRKHHDIESGRYLGGLQKCLEWKARDVRND
ncbi:hypothetical protein [Bacillus haynesii]|uniref:hypothetical protein n=1 Tax=Bacillus haynesii TaxID=1925021 RepID=UPI0022816345|nr:hypothetical protein [Bacillus haynesii]MCY7992607.1 hypothetical protein [Bacillus haynesii]MCY8140961.1 hypothetical protein [Bacillus haynesii]MCY8651707.1 hypothetical protein [Bacillus haynesii]MCY9412505.1 hypothetical protein [Bacillus haynesii]MEC1456233.1 hypothetical protein [Bacillus haynesii]